MFKGLPFFGTPLALKFTRLSIKLVAGILFLTFFLGYQPNFSFPPVKKSVVYAQEEQSQNVQSASVPFVFQLPHPGYLSTYFSSYHPGIDIATGLGMPIKPIAPGTVSEAGFNLFGYGIYVEIDHGQGYKSFYAHMGRTFVQKGQNVTETDSLGEVGLTGHTTGPHTHLELIKNGVKVNPVSILPEIRKYPKSQDFISYGTSSQSAKPKTYTGGSTKVPTLGNLKNSAPQPAPAATPVPKIPSPPTLTDKMDIQKMITPVETKSPNLNLSLF